MIEAILHPLLSQELLWFSIPLAVVSAFLLGFTRSAFGSGGFVVSPLMVLALGAADGLAVVAPLMILSGGVSCWQHRHGVNRRTLIPLLFAAAAGTLLGWWVLCELMHSGAEAVIDRRMEFVVGALALIYVVLVALKDKIRAKQPYDPASWSMVVAGSAVSLSQTVSNTGTPILLSYFLYHGWERERFVSNQACFLFVQNLVKLAPFIALGILHWGNMGTSVLLLPLALVGNYFGEWLFERGGEKLFFGLLLGLLTSGLVASMILLGGRSRFLEWLG